jgi:xanthine dehydrogenase accessory factor
VAAINRKIRAHVLNSRHLIDRFDAARTRGEAMVLVTVYSTLGSTYSKAGTRMLITAAGESQGLISGGCLEGDLAERAASVLQSNVATTVTYDLRDEADELFGLGIGCNGLIEVLLQPLTAATQYEPLASIAAVLLGNRGGALAVVIESESAELPVGATAVVTGDDVRLFGAGAGQSNGLAALGRAARDAGTTSLRNGPGSVIALCGPLLPIPRVLVLGAGRDAVPLVNILAELGWRITIADHRSGYLRRDGFERAEARLTVRPGALASDLTLADYAAIVVMSHHLGTDREYLRELCAADVPYLGLLGPPARKSRLLEELGTAGQRLQSTLRGPVGIDIGADSAESIAVSIAAEIQSVLVRAAGSGSRRTA